MAACNAAGLSLHFRVELMRGSQFMMTMETTLEYLAHTHKALQRDYCIGQSPANCRSLALATAARLVREGNNPSIIELQKVVEDDLFLVPLPFTPLMYNGRSQWTLHQVCCVDNQVYDPLLGREVQLDQYALMAFGEHLPVRVLHTPDETRALVRNSIWRLQ